MLHPTGGAQETLSENCRYLDIRYRVGA